MAGKFYRIVELPAIHPEDVEESVVIVVEESDTAAHRFYQVILFRGGMAMREIDPGRANQMEALRREKTQAAYGLGRRNQRVRTPFGRAGPDETLDVAPEGGSEKLA